MREFRLETFGNLEDAMMWLENELYELELHHDNLKGEVTYIDGQWRVAVMIEEPQLELPFKSDYR